MYGHSKNQLIEMHVKTDGKENMSRQMEKKIIRFSTLKKFAIQDLCDAAQHDSEV